MTTHPGPLRRLFRPRPRRDERGAVAIMVALSMTFLLVATAMVLDFGLVRLDRQQLRNVSDSAAMAGIAAGDAATGDIYTHRAVCGALSSLRSAREFTPSGSFTGLPDSICAASALAGNVNVKCVPGNAATYATYDQTVTRGDVTYRVRIEAPYDPTSGDWAEEDLAGVTADQSKVGGCDQIGVQVWESREPGLGSMATSSDLEIGIRSAARALIGTEDDMAPALILLEQKACSAVTSQNTGALIEVHGINGTPGSIHVDSDATVGCTTGTPLFQGVQNNGIVAYGSVTPPGTSGAVTAYAATLGRPANILSDGLDRVYGTPSTSGTGSPKTGVTGRERVGRRPVDLRYRQPVRAAITAASTVWGTATAANGWTVVNTCDLSSLSAGQKSAGKLKIVCGGQIKNDATITSNEVFLDGWVKGAKLSMSNATRVYLNNANAAGTAALNPAAVDLNNNTFFCVRADCSPAAPPACSTLPTPNRARIFVRHRNISANGGILRMCNSTVFMLGGDTTSGCVPAADNAVPTDNPCPGPAPGTGTIALTGGLLDWTAPNAYADSVPLASRDAAWADFEDLGTWSESAGQYKFTGGGNMNTRGVFMVPNAQLLVGGSASQSLRDAQYVARTFGVFGSGGLSLTTDPRNAVTIPAIKGYVLVR